MIDAMNVDRAIARTQQDELSLTVKKRAAKRKMTEDTRLSLCTSRAGGQSDASKGCAMWTRNCQQIRATNRRIRQTDDNERNRERVALNESGQRDKGAPKKATKYVRPLSLRTYNLISCCRCCRSHHYSVVALHCVAAHDFPSCRARVRSKKAY